MAPTPIRTIRIPPDLYAQVEAEAARRGQTVSEFIRQALQKEVSQS